MLRRRRARRKGAAIFATCVVVLLGVAGYLAYSAYQHVTPLLAGPGCQAGSGTSAVSLDPQQASIAATIAAVAASERLPARAVTVAYATAMQESHMHDLDYGDQDSVGVFQQRPSEGWGTASELEDPVYATGKFFGALIRVPGWLDLPVDQAAQAVQHSADGSAYSQYDLMAATLTSAYTGQRAHAVWCWPGPGPQPRQNIAAAGAGLAAAFGAAARGRPVTSFTVSHSAETAAAAVQVQPAARLDRRLLAGDARGGLRPDRRALRRLPVDGGGRQPGVAPGNQSPSGLNGPFGRSGRDERYQRKYPAPLKQRTLGPAILIADGKARETACRPRTAEEFRRDLHHRAAVRRCA